MLQQLGLPITNNNRKTGTQRVEKVSTDKRERFIELVRNAPPLCGQFLCVDTRTNGF